jgi:hypothetical protein
LGPRRYFYLLSPASALNITSGKPTLQQVTEDQQKYNITCQSDAVAAFGKAGLREAQQATVGKVPTTNDNPKFVASRQRVPFVLNDLAAE